VLKTIPPEFPLADEPVKMVILPDGTLTEFAVVKLMEPLTPLLSPLTKLMDPPVPTAEVPPYIFTLPP
jgi:hypothetical protein